MSNTNSTSTAPYLQFIAGALAEIAAQGLPPPTLDPGTASGLPENDGYCFIEWGAHGVAPAIIVPKSKLRMGSLHSHVDLSGLDGHIPLPKRNGRVVCHFEPDLSKVSRAFARFVGASKAPDRAPVRRPTPASRPPVVGQADSQAAALEVASWAASQASAAGAAEVASWADTDASVDEALAALE